MGKGENEAFLFVAEIFLSISDLPRSNVTEIEEEEEKTMYSTCVIHALLRKIVKNK